MSVIAVLLASAATVARPAPPENSVVVEARRILPSVGLMGDHMHSRGEFMIGVRYQHFDWDGANRRGTHKVSDEELMDAGYMMRATSMTMDMAMVDLMYGVTDDLTLTVSPQYTWNRMTMVALDPMMSMDAEKMKTDGFGDTLASASYRLAQSEHINAHVTLGVWVPTGRSGIKDSDGFFTQYCMQTGSGTWDVEPSATIRWQQGRFGWGAQASYRWRMADRNGSGYRFGNKGLLTAWLSYLVGSNLGATARAEFTHQGRIHGEFDGLHFEDTPPDFPANYGGDLLIGAIGLNWEPTIDGRRGPQLGVELGVPLYQNVNGVQLPQRWQLSAGIRQFF